MAKQGSGYPATTRHHQNRHSLRNSSEQSTHEHDGGLQTTEVDLTSQSTSQAGLDTEMELHDVSDTNEDFLIDNTSDLESSSSITEMCRPKLLQLAQAIVTEPSLPPRFLLMDSKPLKMVSIDPPVTEASLNELNLERIRQDPKLRHDLNFDRDVSFRPNYDGERGRAKKEHAQMYWAVLSVEFAYFMRVASGAESRKIRESLEDEGMQWRMRQVFITIRGILLTLVQKRDADSVKRVLDIDLLLQQLEHGVCDLIELGEWLGTMIKSSCSPVRDAAATAVVENIRYSIMNCNPCKLSETIEQLFSILETMKLDVANHQIRGLRLKMIADTVRYSREYFQQYLQNPHHSFHEERTWFRDQLSAYEQYTPSPRTETSQLEVLSRAVVGMLQLSSNIPQTFTFDLERICEYRNTFSSLHALEAIIDTLRCVSDAICQAKMSRISPSVMQKFLTRLALLDPGFSRTTRDARSGVLPEDILIEIVRAAYESTGQNDTTQFLDHLEWATELLYDRMDVDSPEGCRINEGVWRRLQQQVLEEVVRMIPMDELAMHNYCEQVARAESKDHAEMATGRVEARSDTQPAPEIAPSIHGCEYRKLATKVAHLAVLHWRVWGPILYAQAIIQGNHECETHTCANIGHEDAEHGITPENHDDTTEMDDFASNQDEIIQVDPGDTESERP